MSLIRVHDDLSDAAVEKIRNEEGITSVIKFFELKEKNALPQTFNGSKFSGIRFLRY